MYHSHTINIHTHLFTPHTIKIDTHLFTHHSATTEVFITIMHTVFAVLAAASLLQLSSTTPLGRRAIKKSSNGIYSRQSNSSPGGSTYAYFSGDGSTADGWPALSDWVSYEDMFSANSVAMQTSCTQFGEANDSPTEIDQINNAIQVVAAQTGIDSRFILAIMMQESEGCVRVPTTNNGVRNPGLMQSANGASTCNEGGVVQDPCPENEIDGMISDGTIGTGSGNSLEYALKQAGGDGNDDDTDAQKFYIAARVYNSGSFNPTDLNDALGSTACYVTNVANRLLGQVFPASACSE